MYILECIWQRICVHLKYNPISFYSPSFFIIKREVLCLIMKKKTGYAAIKMRNNWHGADFPSTVNYIYTETQDYNTYLSLSV
jgi:hypothetical protein